MRRTWMLLFVIAMLAIFMAVPAMAAGHNHDDNWNELSAGTEITGAGNYYVPEGGLTGTVTVNCAEAVTICLNGQTWDNSAETVRALEISGGATVTLCDCSETPGTIRGGTVAGSGANIYSKDSSTLIITDITITGGTATTGSGGSIYCKGSSSQLTLGAADKTGAPTISNGSCTASSTNGGNIYSDGYITIYNATIKGGYAKNSAGNLQAAKQLTMHGGEISGGSCDNTSFNKTGYNVFNTNIVMTGGVIVGGVHGQKLYTISGTAVIADPNDSTKGLNISSSYSTSACLLIDESNGAFTGKVVFYSGINVNRQISYISDATITADRWVELIASGNLVINNDKRAVGVQSGKVFIRYGQVSCMCGKTKGNRDEHTSWCSQIDMKWTQLADSTQIAYSGNYYLSGNMEPAGQLVVGDSSNPSRTVRLDLNGYYIKRTGKRVMRVYGNSTISFTDTSSEGTGYIEGGTAPTASDAAQVAVVWLTPNKNAPITCNLYNVDINSTASTYSYGGVIGASSSAAQVTMNIYDSNLRSSAVATNDATVVGTHVSEGGAILDVITNTTVNMYSGTIYGGDAVLASAGGGAIRVKGGTFNLHDGSISGGDAGNGGSVYIESGNFNMYGGTIEGGTANNGGAIYINGGSFSMSGTANIVGGEAEYGGAVYIKSGALTMNGGTINGGNVITWTETSTNSETGVTTTKTVSTSGGAVYVTSNGKFIMNDGTINGSNSATYGGGVYVGGTFEMNKGTINGGTDCSNGGCVFVGNNGNFTMKDGCTLQNGNTTGGSGGNVRMNSGTFTMDGGSIINGSSTNNDGGNISLYDGKFIMNGGTISGGTCSNYGGNIAIQAMATVELNGGTISGGTGPRGADIQCAGSLTVNGATVIGQLHLGNGKTFAVGTEGFATDSALEVSFGDASNGRVFTSGIASVSAAEALKAITRFTNTEYLIGIADDYQLFIAKPGTYGANINGGSDYNGLAITAAKAADGDLITLYSAGADATLTESVWLDLNGNSVTGTVTVAEGKTLKLVDSANIEYVDAGATVAAIEGTVERAFTTGGKLGGNYRFLTIKDSATGAYSAHRIYLAVKSTVLVPDLDGSPAIKYRTVFKCDDTVAGLVDTNYGVVVNFQNADLSAVSHETTVVGAGAENSKVTGLTGILSGSDNDKTKAEGAIKCKAYVTVGDAIGGDLYSAYSVSRTMQELVEEADAAYADLSAAQKSAMTNLWTNWGSKMQGWGWTISEAHYQ